MARMKFRLQNMTTCTFCGTFIKADMYRHVARRHLELAQLWRCPVSWCTVWRGTPQDLMDHVLNGHNVPEGIRRVRLEMFFPPWTVTQQLYEESLSANDVLLFSELGLSLVNDYRVHRSGRPHIIMFNGKYLAQLRALLPLKTMVSTAGRPSGTACPPVASTTSQTDGFDATPQPPRRRRRQQVQFRDTPDQIAPRLTEQDPLMAAGAVVFDCLPVLLSVSVNVSGIDMRASRSAISPAGPVLVPPELERQFGGRICYIGTGL